MRKNYEEDKEPEFYSDQTMFLVTLPNLNYPYMEEVRSAESAESAERSAESADPQAQLSNRQIEILSVMEIGVEYSADEIAEKIGLKGSRTRQLLGQLVKMGLIRTTATTRNRRYVNVMSTEQKSNK